jgi:hypothetical protein
LRSHGADFGAFVVAVIDNLRRRVCGFIHDAPLRLKRSLQRLIV